MMKKLFTLFLMVVMGFSFAQLAPFSITATKVNDETCPANGTITWTTSGTTAGSTMTYSIVNAITGSTVSPSSGNNFTGLVAGTYKIIATQTSGTQSNQATSNNVVVSDLKQILTYSVSKNNDEDCGNDGKFTVYVSKGRPPYTYQLLDASDNVILSQTSNVFSGLAAGSYKARVVDQCGAGLVNNVTINNTQTIITSVGFYGTGVTSDCAYIPLQGGLNLSGGSPAYPMTVKFTYTNPNTGVVESTTGLIGGSSVNDLPKLPNFLNINSLNYTATITYNCGRVFTQDLTFNYIDAVTSQTPNSSCGGSYLSVSSTAVSYGRPNYMPIKLVFSQAPAGFNPSINPDYNNYKTTQNFGSATQPIPAGTYTYDVIDQCGRNLGTFTKTLTASTPGWYTSIEMQCDYQSFALHAYGTNGFTLKDVVVTSAPASFVSQVGSLPYTIPAGNYQYSASIGNYMHINDFPVGNYTFQITNTCDSQVITKTLAVTGGEPFYPYNTPSVTQNCGSQFVITNPEDTYGNIYWHIQKYYPASGRWGDLAGNLSGAAPGSAQPYTSINRNQYTTNATPSKYRAIAYPKTYTRWNPTTGTGNAYYCEPKVLGEFTIKDVVSLDNAYAFQCADGTYDIALSISGGIAPFQYSIVSDETSSATVLINNGSNSIFHGVNSGSYYFRVTDACGNFKTRKLDLAQLGKPEIRFSPDCAAGTLKLVVDGLPELSYEWYKSTNPSAILSTTNVLDLGVYDATKTGVYKVRMFTTNSLYCINSTQEMQITVPSLTEANPGTGQTATIQYSPLNPTINLNNYLTGPYDGNGVFTQISGPSTSLLVGNQWNIAPAAVGTYKFRYTVTPLCTGSAKYTDITIKLEKLCYKLPAMATAGNPALPTTTGITLLSKTTPNTWPNVRNGGWVALEANSNGFVLNRVAFDTNNLPVGIPTANFVTGMAVFDITNKCLKIYDGTAWSCYTTPTCPE